MKVIDKVSNIDWLYKTIKGYLNINECFLDFCKYKQKHTKTLKMLLEYGADIHYKNDQAIKRTCHNHNPDIVKFLVENGACVTINENEPLLTAIQSHVNINEIGDKLQTIMVLLDNGANIYDRNFELLLEVRRHIKNNAILNYLESVVDKTIMKKVFANGHFDRSLKSEYNYQSLPNYK